VLQEEKPLFHSLSYPIRMGEKLSLSHRNRFRNRNSWRTRCQGSSKREGFCFSKKNIWNCKGVTRRDHPYPKEENQWITLQCGKSVFNLAGLDPEEFPSLPNYQEENFSTVSNRLIREMIEKTVFAASNEESRYHLNGVLFVQSKQGEKRYWEWWLRMDIASLWSIEKIKKFGDWGKRNDHSQKGSWRLKRSLGIEKGRRNGIYFNATHGFFKMGKSLTVIRLIDGEFPEYEQVIQKEW